MTQESLPITSEILIRDGRNGFAFMARAAVSGSTLTAVPTHTL